MQFTKLFESVNIGKLQVKNRIAMAPMGPTGLVYSDGTLSQRGIDYYVARAKGGVGLIIAGVFRIENGIEQSTGLNNWNLQALIKNESRYALGELAEMTHYHGSKTFIQLTAGIGRVLSASLIDKGIKPVSASAIPCFWRPEVIANALTTEQVEKLVESFGDAVEILVTADIDGVELHGHEGYLFDQFTTGIWNKRSDKYGGSLEDRLRLPIEVLERIKSTAGKSFPVIYRYGLKHYMKGFRTGAVPTEEFAEFGRDVAEGLEMAKHLEKAGFDALHVDAGCYESYYWAHPPTYMQHGCLVDMASSVKDVVEIPVIAVGRLGIPELAEEVLEAGRADIVALGRSLLSDPEWPKKVQEGKIDDIRPCIGCHDGCLYRTNYTSRPLCCAVNPGVGRERLFQLRRAGKPKEVLIIGGGVAGMEAARVAALRGHRVALCEKTETLGGHLREACVPAFKDDLKRLLRWYITQLVNLQVDVELESEVTLKTIESRDSDSVVVATGSTPVIPKIHGIAKPKVSICTDLLLGQVKAGDVVTIIGGGLVGCEIGLWLARQSKKVTIIEMLPEVATGVFEANRMMLLDMLRKNKVEILTSIHVREIANDGVIIACGDVVRMIECDSVVLACGLKPERELYNLLRRRVAHLYAIGDCKEPRKIMHAIWDGYYIGRDI